MSARTLTIAPAATSFIEWENTMQLLLTFAAASAFTVAAPTGCSDKASVADRTTSTVDGSGI